MKDDATAQAGILDLPGHFAGGALGEGIGLQDLRPGREHRQRRKTAAEFDAGDERTVDADVETELAAIPNGEVRHDLRETLDAPPGLQGEGLVDRQMMDERRRVAQRLRAARTRTGRVDHDAGAEFVVLPEVAVEVAGPESG